ncbi:hypothetical protein LCGC14_2058640 [marine sediment metagenome]|uniref:Uncharacterized protein n=1 Tax=marine sediment metagenome TaxID=412755 RepID=A0A0F9ELQ7_9ZZZZ
MSKDIQISELINFEEQTKRHDGYLSYTVSADYIITDVDKIKTLYVITSTGIITITLPNALRNLDREIDIEKPDAGSGYVVVDGEGAETILGAYVGLSSTTADISQQTGWIRFKSNGISWNIIGGCTPDKWHVVGGAGEPAFANSWINLDAAIYPSMSFRKIISGDIHVQGVVKNGTIGLTIFTLPVGYVPNRTIMFAAVANGAFAQSTILSTGAVVASSGSNVWFSVGTIITHIL